MGINALDAAVQGCGLDFAFHFALTWHPPYVSSLTRHTDTAVSMLRQQLEPTMRVHGIITGSETWAPNIIPKCE
jgi:hypothetical protein